MSENYHNYQLLLAKAALLYEKHGVGRPEPFNVFSVLHKETNEVNLHSRFLHALLDYKKPGTEIRENLKDFLQHVGVEDFELCGVNVEREHCDIDILIINANKKAVIIENKVKAEDQRHQLQRYYKIQKERGYSDIHLLYLTLDGRDPSGNSVGDLDCKLISYEDLIPWLDRCQKRAYDEPELRESVIQYSQLVRRLTGTDDRRKYMNELKELCLEDNNFVLIRNLNDAMGEAGTELLWDEIESELKSKIPDLPDKDEEHSSKGLYYRLSEATSLNVGVGVYPSDHNRIWFGVVCSKEKYKDKYDMLKDALKDVSDGETDDECPRWWRTDSKYLDLKKLKNFKLLSDDKKRQEYAKETAQEIIKKGLKEVWEILEDIAMVNAIKEGEKTEFVSEKQIFDILEGIS